MQLSQHFTLESMIASAKAQELGIDNTPSPAIVEQLTIVARRMEDVRRLLGDRPILVSSGYRCPTLNVAVRGVPTSAHCFGVAVDFTCPQFGTPYQVAKYLSTQILNFDQLIYEFRDWVHISFDVRSRKDLLTIFSAQQGYLPGIVEG